MRVLTPSPSACGPGRDAGPARPGGPAAHAMALGPLRTVSFRATPAARRRTAGSAPMRAAPLTRHRDTSTTPGRSRVNPSNKAGMSAIADIPGD
jgi:hypothetical protein